MDAPLSYPYLRILRFAVSCPHTHLMLSNKLVVYDLENMTTNEERLIQENISTITNAHHPPTTINININITVNTQASVSIPNGFR
ncbi:NADPH--cytochrome P450 reductase 2 [Bienertia sinuspersici]